MEHQTERGVPVPRQMRTDFAWRGLRPRSVEQAPLCRPGGCLGEIDRAELRDDLADVVPTRNGSVISSEILSSHPNADFNWLLGIRVPPNLPYLGRIYVTSFEHVTCVQPVRDCRLGNQNPVKRVNTPISDTASFATNSPPPPSVGVAGKPNDRGFRHGVRPIPSNATSPESAA